MTSLLDTALAYHRAGLTVLPNDPAKKYPAGLKGWQEYVPTDADVRRWFGSNVLHAIGVRDVEGIDIDNKGHPDAEALYAAWSSLVEQLAPGLVGRLLCERTPRGGYHLVWHCETIAGNQKLATRPPTADELRQTPKLTAVSLIETRGRGGQFQVAPSPGYTLQRGDWRSLPTITPAERQILLDCARALSRTDRRTIDTLGRSSGERAGDRFNQDGADEAYALLEADGWSTAYERDGAKYLVRPGKGQKDGIGATFGYVAPGVLYVFSTNAAPFQDGKAYGPFAIYAELQHGGDYKAAAKALHQRYEAAPQRRVNVLTGEIIDPHAPPAPALPADWRVRGVTLADLQHRVFPPERWLIEGIFPEGATLLAAKYKSKKSWIGLALGIAIAMGGKALGQLEVSRGRVLYLDLEGKQQRIQKRTRAMLGVRHIDWPDNFHVYTKWPQGDEGLIELEQWFSSYPDTALAVIDVLASLRRPIQKHEEIYRYDRDTVDPINELFERHHAGALLIHHFNKGKHDDIMDAITGSTGLPSAVNTLWGLARDPNDSSITVLHLRGRDLENDDPLALRWDSYLNMHVIEGPANEVSMSGERKAVLKVFADDQAHTPKEVAAALGKPVPAIQFLLRKLLNEGLIDKVGYGKYAVVAQSAHTPQSAQSAQSAQSSADRDSNSERHHTNSERSDRYRSEFGSRGNAVNANSEHSEHDSNGSVFGELSEADAFNLRMRLRSNKDSDQEVARERCELFSIDYDQAYKEVRRDA